jgi:transposase
MTTTAVTTAAGPILAIDLDKYKCVACVYHAADRYTFHAIETSRSEVERLIRRTGPAVVVIEACSLAGWVHDLCAALGVRCQVANTGAEAWKYKHAKRKTDRDDALRLAQLDALGQLPEVVVPAKPVRE